MNYKEAEIKLRKIIADKLGFDPEDIGLEVSPYEVGLDSLDVIEIIMDVEDEFNIDIPLEVMEHFETGQHLLNYLALFCEQPERILCAAIHLDDGKKYPHQSVDTGRIFSGYRHHNIFQLLPQDYDRKKAEQGFLTSAGRFVNRQDAMAIALVSGQVKQGKTLKSRALYSEDLY